VRGYQKFLSDIRPKVAAGQKTAVGQSASGGGEGERTERRAVRSAGRRTVKSRVRAGQSTGVRPMLMAECLSSRCAAAPLPVDGETIPLPTAAELAAEEKQAAAYVERLIELRKKIAGQHITAQQPQTDSPQRRVAASQRPLALSAGLTLPLSNADR